jgi:alpha-galactosidase
MNPVPGGACFHTIRLLAAITLATPVAAADFHDWASTPPMGWNSWDCFATTVTEAQTKAQADFMAAKLKAHGWQYIVVDIQWYEPGAKSYDYRKDAPLTMDGFGRLLPAPNRFPSAADGAGFKPLADYVHGLGLKFGLHLMRGIPRQAVARNLPVKGAGAHAATIANVDSTCPWNPDMYGVDMAKPGAQAYYDSVFALIASWGVDYVKVDDISRPYHEHEAEIEAIRRAIDRTGRPIVLSLSPGEAALSAADHVMAHANLWRISDDFWDNWPALHEQFARLERWNSHRGPGSWPDADMLPFGALDLGQRTTHFTRDEQTTVMTLWSIARSPLMHGGDMTKTDDFTLALLTNDDVLAVNQRSTHNRPLFDRDGLIAWTADVPDSADKYLAVFNARDRLPLTPDRLVAASDIVNRQTPRYETPITATFADATKLFLVVDDAGDGTGWDHALWIDPRLRLADGVERSLVDVPWVNATAGWGRVSTTIAPGGKPLSHLGRPVPRGIATHARSVIEFDLPADAVGFSATGALDDGTINEPRGGTVRFQVYASAPGDAGDPAGVTIEVALADCGFTGAVAVRDLWTHADVATTRDHLTTLVPWHGAKLFRLSPRP